MKKLFPVFLCAAMLLTSCGEPNGDSESSAEITAETTVVVTTNESVQTDAAEPDTKSSITNAEKQTATTAGTAATTASKNNTPDPAPSGEELPIVGGDDDAVIPEKPAEGTKTAPAVPSEFDDDGVIELPIIPLR